MGSGHRHIRYSISTLVRINLLVIRTSNPEVLKDQYEHLGFSFDYHQHEKGSFNYASEQNGFVFEIYPLTKSLEKADNSIRLGFDIKNLKAKMDDLKETNWRFNRIRMGVNCRDSGFGWTENRIKK